MERASNPNAGRMTMRALVAAAALLAVASIAQRVPGAELGFPAAEPRFLAAAEVPDTAGAAPDIAAAAQAPDTAGAAPDTAALRPPESYGVKRRLLRGAAEVFTVNLVQNLFGKYIMDEKEGFTIGLNTWEENLKAGMNWDDNSFSTNNFRHPYQGAMYFNAGRANRFGFYQSSIFAFAGSWSWEYLGEAHNPSFNDFVNTAVGGVVLGEIMHRLSTIVLDNTATGSGRTWREIGALVINPVRGFNRMFTGEAFERHANPPDRFPIYWRGEFRTGSRTLSDDRLFDESGQTKMFVAFDATYGNPFERMAGPYDHFDVGMQVNFNNRPHGIGRLEVRGLLGGGVLSRSEKTTHLLTGYQHFDYLDNEAYTYGGMSFGASLLSLWDKRRERAITSAVELNAILLGATKNDYFNISGRGYDYGPGASLKLRGTLGRHGWHIVTFESMTYYIHSVNGGGTDSWSLLNRLKVNFPLREYLGAGGEVLVFHSDRSYDDFPSVHARNPELRLYLTWKME
jgi:hypothetical protein